MKPSARPVPLYSAERSNRQARTSAIGFQPGYPRILGIALINILCRELASNMRRGQVTTGDFLPQNEVEPWGDGANIQRLTRGLVFDLGEFYIMGLMRL